MRTIERIKNIEGVKSIYTAWGPVIHEPAIMEALEKSNTYIRKISETVKRVSARGKTGADTMFCTTVLAELGFPAYIANPLIERSINSFR